MLSKFKFYFSLGVYYFIFIHLPSASVSKYGVVIRMWCVRYIFGYVGENINIAKGVRFGKGSKISISHNSGIGENSYIVCMDYVTIGQDVMIGPEVMILTGGHDYKDEALLLREQKILTAPVSIGNDCWIGSRVIILPGVSICDRVIVGAGSVVSKSIQEPGIYVGNPAKKIKDL